MKYKRAFYTVVDAGVILVLVALIFTLFCKKIKNRDISIEIEEPWPYLHDRYAYDPWRTLAWQDKAKDKETLRQRSTLRCVQQASRCGLASRKARCIAHSRQARTCSSCHVACVITRSFVLWNLIKGQHPRLLENSHPIKLRVPRHTPRSFTHFYVNTPTTDLECCHF